MQLSSETKTELQKQAFKEIDLTLERQALARQTMLPLAIVTRRQGKVVKTKQVKQVGKKGKSKKGKSKKPRMASYIHPDINADELTLQDGLDLNPTELMEYYTIKASQLQHIGFKTGKIEKSQWNIQDVNQETIIKMLEKYQGKKIDELKKIYKRTMNNTTVDKYRYESYSLEKNNLKPFIEFSSIKTDIESEKIYFEGKQIANYDYWENYRETLQYVYFVLSGRLSAIRLERKKQKKNRAKQLPFKTKLKFKMQEKNRKNIVLFNYFHVKQYTIKQIAEKTNIPIMTVFDRLKRLQTKLLRSGIIELFRMDYILFDYRIPEYTYPDIPPKDMTPNKNILGKTVYSNDAYPVSISDYVPQKKVARMY